MYRKWSAAEEKLLVELAEADLSLDAIAERLNRKRDAVRMKLARMGFNVSDGYVTMTDSLKLPEELPSLEQVLKIVAAAIQKACEPGLRKTELQRLAVIANLYKAYADGLERYVGYRKIEEKLLEMERKFAEREKKKSL